MPQSVWDDSTTIKKFDSLPGDTKTDILIIGGGLCGILCAWFLHREGADLQPAASLSRQGKGGAVSGCEPEGN